MNTDTDSSDLMPFSMANAKADNKPQIYTGVTANLNVTLLNNTGGDIILQPGDSASTIEVFMPGGSPAFFTKDQLGAMTITNMSPSDWTFTYDSDYFGLLLTYTGGEKSTWKNGSQFTFDINTVLSNASPTIASVKMNLNNLNGTNVPASPQPQPLTLSTETPPEAPKLTEILNVTLDNQGAVFVSASSDPLSNAIYLNFKNTSPNPLYDDPSKTWTGNPIVTVSFLYGNTAGALAPDKDSGEAWDIAVSGSTTSGWGYSNPSKTGGASSPAWTLYPNQNNRDILGPSTSDTANVTFEFSNINSFTPVGHTQMYVQFSGFQANSTTPYNSASGLFVVDIVKQKPPPTRGLLSFYGTSTNATDASVIKLAAPTSNIAIPLRWSMFYVDNIKLIWNLPGESYYSRNYFLKDQQPNIKPLDYDVFTVEIPIQITQNTPVFITLQAFDNDGAYLNAMQYTVFIVANFFVDPAGKVYPTIFVNGQTWLAMNYDYETNGSVAYCNNTGYQAKYGLLYTEAAAQSNIPAGWRIPTQDDWSNLFEYYTKTFKDKAFEELTASDNFNAQAGGIGDGPDDFNSLGDSGNYWTSTPVPPPPSATNYKAFFYVANSSMKVTNTSSTSNFLSLRYVKNS